METRKSSAELRIGLHRFPSVLVYAVHEWLLMFLLFVDALLSYIITKFASSSKLQPPCLLCSRLDHVLGSAKPGFYRELICHAHQLEISSLFYCRTHEKLAEVRGSCEGCLLTFAAEKKSNPEAYKLLVGKLGFDLESHAEGDHKISNCSCCNEPFKSRSCLHGLLHTRSVGADGFENKIGNLSSVPLVTHVGNHGFDSLSHVGYTQLNITSDTESEVPMSDEECGSFHARSETEDFKVETKSFPESGGVEVHILPEIPLVDISPEKPNLQATPMPDTLSPFDLISADGASSSAKIVDTLADESEDKCVTEIGKTENCSSETALNSTKDDEETFKPANDLVSNISGLKMNEIIDDPSSSMPKSMDLNDAYNLAVGNKGSRQSDIFTELIGKESIKIQEDLKLLLSQLSASRGIELPLLDMGAKMHGYSDDFKVSGSPSPIGLHILNKRISIERNLSGLSVDGSIVSEIEGENVVDRLKRQIEFDRKNMGALYKELEEERSASTIAATQAMAMITRLQEEKAAMQMEALQYQRMMEEQAEYDQEGLQQANELLAQREKELQDVEAELASYRKRFHQESETEDGITPRFLEESVKNETQKADRQHIRNSTDAMKDSLLEFENEKSYISERLKNLEKNLHFFSNNGIDGCIHDRNGNRGDDLSDKNSEDMVLSGFPSANTDKDEQNHNHDCMYPKVDRETYLISIKNEVSDLNKRLHALESDRNFLEHAINSLRNGNEGVQFIQEIACHLRELRRIGITRTVQTVV